MSFRDAYNPSNSETQMEIIKLSNELHENI